VALIQQEAIVPLPAEADEPQRLVPVGAAAPDEPYDDSSLAPEDLDVLAFCGEDGEIRPNHDQPNQSEHGPPGRGLLIGGALLAVVLSAGVAYVIMRSAESVATLPIVAADARPAKVVPPADDNQQKKLIYDRVAAQGADQTQLVIPDDVRIAAAPASSGDYKPISRVIEPGGPGFDPPPQLGDLAATSAAAPADLELYTSMRSLLTSLGYYRAPDLGEDASAALARALTTWLFHHDLPADTPVSEKLIREMREDLAKGIVRSVRPAATRTYKSSLPASWKQVDCQNALSAEAHLRLGPIGGLSVSQDGHTVTLAHDEKEWSQKSSTDKNRVVDLVNCALAGPGQHVITLEVHSNTSDRLLARWTEAGGLE
jgi:hypothetical protein